MQFITKVGNTRTALKAILDPVEAFADVDKVYFTMYDLSYNEIVHREASSWDGEEATVVFQKAELKEGEYYGEFAVLYTDGKVEYFPSEGFIQIIIKRNLKDVS